MMDLAPLVLILNDNACTCICNTTLADVVTTKDNVMGEIRASLSILGRVRHVSCERDTCLGVTN